MSGYLCHKTIDEPRVYREYSETKSGGYEVTLETGVKVKYRREEVEIFDKKSEASKWLFNATQERIQTLRNRIDHIEAEYLAADKALEGEL